MKKLTLIIFSLLSAVAAFAATERVVLAPGENALRAGKICAASATTKAAATNVTIAAVSTVAEYTNTYVQVIKPHTLYSFSITNYDGNAAIATNTVDRFSYADWRNGPTNFICSAISATAFATTNSVVSGKGLKAAYTSTNTLVTITVSAHHGSEVPATATWHYGESVIVTGSSPGDSVCVLVE